MPLSDLQIQALARDAVQRATAGDFAGAEPLLAQMAEARPNSGQVLNLLGQARLKLGRFAEAREPLERAAKFLPKDAAAQVNLAGCLSVLGEHDKALTALERAALLKPGDAAIAHNRGRALEALGRADEAERAYDEALSIDHRLMPSLSARASLLLARGDWMGALGDLDMALTTRPNDPHLRLRRGELLLRQGDWLRGLADYEARLDIAGERYAPDLPRWQGEKLTGRLLIYPEQADIESDSAMRDTLMLARGVDAVVQCAPQLARVAGYADDPSRRLSRRFRGGRALAQPAASPGLDARTPCRRPARHGSRPNPRPVSAGSPAASRRPASPSSAIRPDRAMQPGRRQRHGVDAPRRACRHSDDPAAGSFRRLAVGSTDRNVAVVSDAGRAARGRERKAGGAAWEVLISAPVGGRPNGQDPVRQDLGQPRHRPISATASCCCISTVCCCTTFRGARALQEAVEKGYAPAAAAPGLRHARPSPSRRRRAAPRRPSRPASR